MITAMNYLSVVKNYLSSKFKTRWPMKHLEGEEGIVIIEYVLIGALVAVALIVTFGLLKTELANILTYIITKLQEAQA